MRSLRRALQCGNELLNVRKFHRRRNRRTQKKYVELQSSKLGVWKTWSLRRALQCGKRSVGNAVLNGLKLHRRKNRRSVSHMQQVGHLIQQCTVLNLQQKMNTCSKCREHELKMLNKVGRHCRHFLQQEAGEPGTASWGVVISV